MDTIISDPFVEYLLLPITPQGNVRREEIWQELHKDGKLDNTGFYQKYGEAQRKILKAANIDNFTIELERLLFRYNIKLTKLDGGDDCGMSLRTSGFEIPIPWKGN